MVVLQAPEKNKTKYASPTDKYSVPIVCHSNTVSTLEYNPIYPFPQGQIIFIIVNFKQTLV